MELRIRKKGDIYIIFIIRSLGITNMVDFKNQVKMLVEKGAKKVIISFEHAKYIDSSGITALLSMNTYMKEKSVDFRLAHIRGPVKLIFSIAHLDLLFPISETKDKAIEELGASL